MAAVTRAAGRTTAAVAPDYVRAPWHLRLRWWLAALVWRYGESLEETGAESPEQANPLWRR